MANEPGPDLMSRQQKILHFTLGFLGWYALNGAIWAAILSSDMEYKIAANLLLFPLNLGALVFFGRRLRWLGLGILVALALNFLISLVLQVWMAGACFIPFFHHQIIQ